MIQLDTHVVVWLYAGETELLSPAARAAIDANELVISPAVLLELQYLHEIGWIAVGADRIVQALDAEIGLGVVEVGFTDVVRTAFVHSWTRDPFDRLIVATAAMDETPLLTKDKTILQNYRRAFWQREAGG